MNGSLDELAEIKAPSEKPPENKEAPASQPDLSVLSSQLQDAASRLSALEIAAQHMVSIAKAKDRWITRMFVYCCVLTFIVTAALIVLCLCQ